MIKNVIKILFLFSFMLSCTVVNAQRKRSTNKAKHVVHVKKEKKKGPKSQGGGERGNESSSGEQTTVVKLSNDTPRLGSVTVFASFKPSLRSAAKINFTASAPEMDTNRFTLNYNIPAQNLIFSYQPVPIKPLALTSDSEFTWQNHQYIKAGFGNFTTPYFETGLAFGHPSNALYTIFGKFVSSKGSIPFQEYTKANLKLSGAFAGITNHELLASITYNLCNQNKYGVNPKSGYAFSKDSLAQNFNLIEADISLHSKTENSYGVTYHPQIKASYFFDNNNANEINAIIKAPITKNISDATSFNLGLNADISSYTAKQFKIANNIFSIAPSIKIKARDYAINLGVQPTWDNSVFAFLPNIFGEYKLTDETLILTGGWLGYFQKNNYKNLAALNPFIEQPSLFQNTKISEIFAGLKGSVEKHFTYNAQLSFLKFTNQVLFVNDSASQKSQTFNILYEPVLNAFRISGEVGYTEKEKFSAIAALKYTQFTSQQLYPKAYGYIPLEITGTLKYKLMKDIFLKSDLFFMSGSDYRVQTIQTAKTGAAFDLNIGAEYKVLSKLNVYLDFNNLFNNQYQRWNQYNVLGFNIVGGVVYSFH